MIASPTTPAGTVPTALTIAGSDSGGGAGIQGDLKTFLALGVHGMSAITSVTAQSTRSVSAIHELPPAFVHRQIAEVAADLGVDAAKTGMLANSGIVCAVADAIAEFGIRKLVVDPVLVSGSGDRLLTPDAVEVLISRLFPLALVVTPNLPEAEALLGREVTSLADMRQAAQALREMGPDHVLVKGGHLEGPATDVLFDGGDFVEISSERLQGATHGTGCALSAAITAYLARGESVEGAVRRAKEFVTGAIRHRLPIGRGDRPVNPGWALERSLHLAGLDAGSADPKPPGGAVDHCAHGLDVGGPAPVGPAV